MAATRPCKLPGVPAEECASITRDSTEPHAPPALDCISQSMKEKANHDHAGGMSDPLCSPRMPTRPAAVEFGRRRTSDPLLAHVRR